MFKSQKTPKKSKNNQKPQLSPLQRLSLFFFMRPRKTVLILLTVVLFGAACYSTLLKREGFPSINTPFAVANGSYLVNDPAKVDADIAKPLSNFLLKQEGVKSVETKSFGNFYSAIVSYKDNVNATARSVQLNNQISAQHILPAQATVKLAPFEFGFTERGDDMVVSFYDKHGTATTEDLVAQGKKAAAFIWSKDLPLVKGVAIIDPYESALDPTTGTQQLNQKSFDRFGKREDNKNNFYSSVVVGIKAEEGADNLELDAQVQSAVDALNKQPEFKNYTAVISASFAPQITEQINELQTSLLLGLIAVLIIGSIVIAVRASFVIVLSMVTVIAIVNGLLYLAGYSLNTITLFALILGLSLIVDDTIIMVEALDSQRRKQKDPAKAVTQATGKVSRAMIAATSTSVLSFAPLLFVGGILGSFIRAIPVTIIASLLISLLVALVFIPLFARFLLLGKKQMGEEHVHELAAGFEARIAKLISQPMLWAKGSTKKLLAVGVIALVIGFGFIGAGGYLFQKVTFNIFPPSKDANQLSTTIVYKPNTDIKQAQIIADKVDKIVGDTTGDNFAKASYFGQANIQSAMLVTDVIDYKQRDITAPQIIKQLNDKFKNFDDATVASAQLDNGPPAAAFTVKIDSSQNREGAMRLASDLASYLTNDAQLKRPDGSIAKIDSVAIGNSSIYARSDGKAYVDVTAKFVDDDTTTLVTLAKDAVEKKFTQDKVASYDLNKNAISFDTGQEAENQDSFKTLALAFPALLLVIYFVLAFQFRSLLQPLLIFMAIPFSLFGITLGLYLTDNAFSFFAMLGFFALIGLSIKNTILLTDYANQSRKAGMHPVDAAHEALAERFRPLIATSLTAVVSLIPLAISSPFWEGLAVVLIFGLLSSTFLVITVFPYYYLGSEFLRQRVNRRTGLGWLLLTILSVFALSKISASLALLAPVVAAILVYLVKTAFPGKSQ
ncbi:MAG: hypothetical protein JWO35_112 [Candidatus Saccharibacteria bacterium]|nr:hypothetical protein [Candidatus Saccharibacteria bacterium]